MEDEGAAGKFSKWGLKVIASESAAAINSIDIQKHDGSYDASIEYFDPDTGDNVETKLYT